MNITLSVSIGEALDKLTILTIKNTKISDLEKRRDIENEIKIIEPNLSEFVNKYNYHYNMLTLINYKIWESTDNIRYMDQGNKDFSKFAKKILDDNDARFRIKNKINSLANSFIKEQKNFNKISNLIIPYVDFKDWLIINYLIKYLTLQYDKITIYCLEICKEKIQYLFSEEPFISFIYKIEAKTEFINFSQFKDHEEIYNYFNIPYGIVTNFLGITRNFVKEEKFKEKAIPRGINKYIFLYDTNDNIISNLKTDLFIYHPFRNYYLFPQNEKERQFNNLWNGNLSDNIFDYCVLLENAESIHLTFSDYFHLCQYLNLNNNISLTVYNVPTEIGTSSNSNWNFIHTIHR